ncbi:hypothetical protein GCM10010353_42880 [Streptomyces chryseus]|nr:hypothetical protein GCM10010353_42880 [Streptomyces chryseus]
MSFSAPLPASQSPADRRTYVRTVLDLGDVLLHPWGRGTTEPRAMVDGLIAAASDPLIALWNPLATADRSDALAWLEISRRRLGPRCRRLLRRADRYRRRPAGQRHPALGRSC